MKDVKKLKKKFIDECNSKLQSKKKTKGDISKSSELSDSTIKDFFAIKVMLNYQVLLKF